MKRGREESHEGVVKLSSKTGNPHEIAYDAPQQLKVSVEKMPKQCGSFDKISKDAIECVMRFLKGKDVVNLSETCKKMRDVAQRESVWMVRVREEFEVEKDKVFDKERSWKEIFIEETQHAKDGNSLYCCAGDGDIGGVRCCLRRGDDVNLGEDGWTPLYEACLQGHLEVIKLLLGAGADVNLATDTGCLPLGIACLQGHLELIKLLLGAGADVNPATNSRCRPLNDVCYEGHLELVKLLLDAGADVNLANEDGGTPLMYASWKGHVEVAKLLLGAGADVNLANNKGQTALYTACWYDRLEIVKMLLDADADMGRIAVNGNTALCCATRYGYSQIANLLKIRGAKPLPAPIIVKNGI